MTLPKGRPALQPEHRKSEQSAIRWKPAEAAQLDERMRAEGFTTRAELVIACVGIALGTVAPGQMQARLREVLEEDSLRPSP